MAGILSSLNTNQQQELIYVGYFTRAADGKGFTFWSGQNVKAQNSVASGGFGQTAEVALTNIANSFAPQPETTKLYPLLASFAAGGAVLDPTNPVSVAAVEAFINAVFQNLFNRDADAEGKTFWSKAIFDGAAGKPGGIGIGAAVLGIANGAKGDDVATIKNKVDVALDFTTKTAAAGFGLTDNLSANFLAEATLVVKGTTKDAASVTAQEAETARWIAAGGDNISDIVLTPNIDFPGAVPPAANTTGTDGTNSYSGVIAAVGATLNTGDIIDGKLGNDILKIIAQGIAVGAAPVPTLTSVETITVTATAPSALNLLQTTGTKTLELSAGSSTFTFTNVGTLADISVKNTTAGSGLNVTYTAAAVAGAADTQKVALDNAILTAGLVVEGIETIAITSTGKNTVGTIADASLKAVTSAGAGSLTIGGFTSTALASFDASTATGVQKVTFNTASDVAVKGGSADDVFAFGATFTSKDTVDGGGGKDTVSLNGGDFRLATSEGAKGIQAFVSVENVEFTGAAAANAAQIDQSTLTNTSITKYIFNTSNAASNDTVDAANATTIFATGPANAGNETFVLKAGNTTLNLALEGTAQTAGPPAVVFDDANIATLDTGAALIVKLSSTGVNSLKVAGTDFNDIATVTNAAGATFTVTGDANTTIGLTGGFANGVNLDASGLSGIFQTKTSAAADNIKGGTSTNDITAALGVDNIDIAASSTKVDTVHLNGILAQANRDSITSFTTGTGGDLIAVNAVDTFAATAAGAPAQIQNVTSNAGATVFNATANDVLGLNFVAGGAGLAASTDGTALLASVGTITTDAAAHSGYIVAYQGGNAFLYWESGAAAALTAADIHLVGTLNNVAVGSVTAANFLLQ